MSEEQHAKATKRQKTSETDFKTRQEEEESKDSSSDDQGSSSEEEIFTLQKIRPEIPTGYLEKDGWARLIVILEQANLETTKTKRGIEILNCDDH